MLCPGCGFENENDNKFCNMCGMALPDAEGNSNAPAEREPLLDLSFDELNLNESSSSDDGLNLDLTESVSDPSQANTNTNEAESLDFDLGAVSDNSNSIDLDLNVGNSEISFDTADTQNDGLVLDLDNSRDENLSLDMDLNEGNSSTINIDTTMFMPKSYLPAMTAGAMESNSMAWNSHL